MFSCSFCDYKTPKKANLRLHYQRKYKCFEKKDGKFTCSCGYVTVRRRDWQTHADKCWQSTPAIEITPNAHVQQAIKQYDKMYKFRVENSACIYAIKPIEYNASNPRKITHNFEIVQFKINGKFVIVGHIKPSEKKCFPNGAPIYEFTFDCANQFLCPHAGKTFSCFNKIGEKIYPSHEIEIYAPGNKKVLANWQKKFA